VEYGPQVDVGMAGGDGRRTPSHGVMRVGQGRGQHGVGKAA
jgi:hypothetical protein